MQALAPLAGSRTSSCCYSHNSYSPKAHIDIIRGYGKFTADPEPTIEVDGKKYTAPHILIATGGRPTVPPDSEIPGEPDKIPWAAWKEVCQSQAGFERRRQEGGLARGAKGALLCRCQPGDHQRRLLRPGGAAQVKRGSTSPPRRLLLAARHARTRHRRSSAGAALLWVPATSRWKSRGSFPRWVPSHPS